MVTVTEMEMTINGNKSNPLTVTVMEIFLLTVTSAVTEKNQYGNLNHTGS